jgi:hypothetical protein
VAAILLVVVIASISNGSSDAPAADLGGDYPAFYGAGRMAREGAWDRLYELQEQVAVQEDLHPEGEQVARLFAYPPQVALAYQPFAALDYHWSYLVHTLMMGMLLWLAILMARPMIPWLAGRELLALSFALVFWPMYRAITGGSNTALTVFLVIAVWRLVHEDRQFAAGILLALLLYKPQFALPLGGLFLLGRYSRLIAGAVVGAVAFFALGAYLQGIGWVWRWLSSASEFGKLDADLNGHSSISFLGFLQNAIGVDSVVAGTLGWLLAALTAAALAWMWGLKRTVPLGHKIALTMPGILLLSPHAMSHDGAVVLITTAIVVSAVGTRRASPWLIAILLLGASQFWISSIGFSPGFPMLLLVAWWAYRETALGIGPGSEQLAASQAAPQRWAR